MPRRCKFEVEKRGGCRKGTCCAFFHPGTPGWDAAPEGFGRGSRPSFSSNRAIDGSGGVPKSANEWDKSAWGPTASNTIKLPDHVDRWGAPSQPEASSPKVKGVQSTWDSAPTLDNQQGGSGGSGGGTWGASSSNAGWGGAAPATWGSGANPAWGSLLGNEGESKKNERESGGDDWSTGGSTSTWEEIPRGRDTADNTQKSEGKGKQKEDVKMRDPSPPRDAWSAGWSAGPQDASLTSPAPPPPDKLSKNSVLPRIDPNVRPLASGLISQSPVITSPTFKPPASSSVLQSGFSLEPELKKEALGLLATWRAQEEGKVLPLNSDTKSSTPTTHYIGPKGRVALFSDIINHMQDVVVCQVLLLRAQEEEDRWKRTQASQEYERASFRTRQMLDSHRTTYADKVKNAKKQLHKALGRLMDLPDFATQNQTVGPGWRKEALTTYTTEFKEWVQDLELHRRVLLEQAATSPKRQTPQEFFERGNWTFRELKEAISQLEERLTNTAEEIYTEVYTKFDDFTLGDDLPPLPPDGTAMDFGSEMDDVEGDTGNVLNSLLQQASRTTELTEKVDQLEKEIALIMKEKASVEQLLEQAELQLSELQQLRAAEESEIQMITQQIQTLYLHNPAAPTPSIATLGPVQINDILDHIRPIVVGQLEKDIAPILATLRQRCLENQNSLTDEIDEMVKPILAMTDEIFQRAQPSSGPHSQ